MKDIMLRIVGKQINRYNEADDNEIEFVTQARAYRKKNAVYVVYTESEVSGMEGVKASLKIGDDGEVSLRRFVDDDMAGSTMRFVEGRRFESFYDTPMGSLPMEILTNSITGKVDEKSFTGTLNIEYEVALKGLMETRTQLKIEMFDRSSNPVEDKEIEDSKGNEDSGLLMN